jgi:CRISPR system Cascade subunit CasE
LIRVPVGKLVGPYGAHKIVYEAANCKRPVWRRYADHALVVADAPSDIYPSKPYDPSPAEGMNVRFDLFANVSVDKPVQGGRSTRIDPVLQAWIDSGRKAKWQTLGFEIGIDWLSKRQAGHGFHIPEGGIDLADYEALEFLRNGKLVRLGTVSFSGMLTVTDPEKFKSTMLSGIGHAKAWGCGLLLCKRI